MVIGLSVEATNYVKLATMFQAIVSWIFDFIVA